MKVTVVPAQVTTVEDRIAGSLSMSQILLLSVPVFLGSFLYMILPPGMHGAIYKYLLLGALAITCSILAIRIKGMIVLIWLVILARYYGRPRRYSFMKRIMTGRPQDIAVIKETNAEVFEAEQLEAPERLTDQSRYDIEHMLATEYTGLILTAKKGGLHVHVTKAK
jgi:hypothetical protein